MRFGLCLLAALLSLLHVGASASTLAEKLLTSEYVLLMRHALAPGVGDPQGYSLDRCDTQRNLDEQGKQQAVRAGNWLRQQGLDKAKVLSSVWCRCQQTAELLAYGPVSIEPSLASFFDTPDRADAQNQVMQRMLANMLLQANRKPLILVTHHVNILQYVGENIGSGDMVLVRVGAQGQALEYSLMPSP
jgi:phosphohistidine phosphatase SixA